MADNIQHEDFGEKIGGAKKDLWKDRGLYVNVSALQILVIPFSEHTAYLRSSVVYVALVIVTLERASVFANVLVSNSYHIMTSQFM